MLLTSSLRGASFTPQVFNLIMANGGTFDDNAEVAPSSPDVSAEVKEDDKTAPESTESETSAYVEAPTEVKASASDEAPSVESNKKKKKKESSKTTSSSKLDIENEYEKENDVDENVAINTDDTSRKATKVSGIKEGKGNDKQEGKVDEKESSKDRKDLASGPVVSSSKKTRPPYKYDPDKITLRFLFANKDGLTITVECKPEDTVGEVKGQLISVWPKDLDPISGGDQLRLICMGKGILMPDSRTLKDFEVPVFKTHPTPINVAVRPQTIQVVTTSKSSKKDSGSCRGGSLIAGSGGGGGGSSIRGAAEESGQGCGCIIS